ncbi:hypothetical protein G7Y89_g7158 [Cudoniella acicularis]|uniref:DUF1014 domain-containing protein n=1 Tax=Cudoniella acicularis TaxID=354080 RepID=A0A8H4RKM9_9HELO|nr:hypothetical protein G7Y89_g7158 [Cudoniella acicularis]
MAGKKAAGENTKKASGNVKKAEAAAQRAAAENAKVAAVEDQDWSKGAKSNAKKRKKLDRRRKNAKQAVKKSKGLDLSQLEDDAGSSNKAAALHASGIDNALDALSLTADSTTKVDKHPERRFKAAFAAFEERRLKEMDEDGSGQGLRQNQKREKIRKEFEKSEENPFNQVSARYDASKEELKEIKEQEKTKIEARLAAK